ncbi:retroviral-like aspartic protease family protein [Temperatibacter marinus]|uniref:Retroviral-like aspartic protease family protein n=1 Tax=Temperatibacter marinus TaxID=1456591 RepID=A0AA52EFT2_9PROT|nr:aspartyl protease family protein [Temperatibacter marinus]WND01737.1 retroviral-like aspartic protease family protein [Temperatibacter marinus]
MMNRLISSFNLFGLCLTLTLLSLSSHAFEKDFFKRQLTLDFEWERKGRILVPVTVHSFGQQLFLFDSAAGGTTIYQDPARLVGAERLIGKSQKILTSTGMETASLYNIRKLSFGMRSQTYAGLPALREYSQRKEFGVLALDLILWQVYEVSPKENKIHIYKYADHFAKKAEWVQLEKGTMAGNAVFVKLLFNDHLVEAMVDTGASTTILNRAAYEKIARPDEGRAKKYRKITGSASSSVVGQEVLIDVSFHKELGTGVKDHKVLITDLPAFSALGLQDQPMILLGMDLLSSENFVLDMRHSRLFLRRK